MQCMAGNGSISATYPFFTNEQALEDIKRTDQKQIMSVFLQYK